MYLRPQLLAAGIALLVLVPVVLYQIRLDRPVFLVLSLLSVVLIVASLYTVFSPAEEDYAWY